MPDTTVYVHFSNLIISFSLTIRITVFLNARPSPLFFGFSADSYVNFQIYIRDTTLFYLYVCLKCLIHYDSFYELFNVFKYLP